VVSSGEQQTALLEDALFVARTISELPFDLNLWQAQNIWYDIYLRLYPAIKARSTANGAKTSQPKPEPDAESARADEWVAKFKEIGQLMGISVDELVIEEETPILEAAPQS